ncbi:hypothetical protein EI94DRAFT_1701699 [Lactarius quietus]|nr:hypothetical protein EI94DRAFT_1701699 [Lactarius quietus]
MAIWIWHRATMIKCRVHRIWKLSEAVSNASEKMLENNGHFLAVEIARLQDVVTTHAKENNNLKVEVKMLKESLALFTNDYHEGSHSTGHILSTIRSGNLPARPAPKKCDDCCLVTQWTRKEFRRACMAQSNSQRGHTDGDLTSAQKKGKCGRPCKESNNDSKTSHTYLENIDGVPVSEEQITEMSRKISMKAWEHFSAIMLADKSFEFLLLWDDGEWKLREWSMQSYPSWHRNRFNKDADDASSEDLTPGPTPASDATRAGPQEQQSEDSDAGYNDDGAYNANGNDEDEMHQDMTANDENTPEQGPGEYGAQAPNPLGTLLTTVQLTSRPQMPCTINTIRISDQMTPASSNQVALETDTPGCSAEASNSPLQHISNSLNNPAISTAPPNDTSNMTGSATQATSTSVGGASAQVTMTHTAPQETQPPHTAAPAQATTPNLGPQETQTPYTAASAQPPKRLKCHLPVHLERIQPTT